jgi:hypothetical protein
LAVASVEAFEALGLEGIFKKDFNRLGFDYHFCSEDFERSEEGNS